MRSNFSHFLVKLHEDGNHGRERLSLGDLPNATRSWIWLITTRSWGGGKPLVCWVSPLGQRSYTGQLSMWGGDQPATRGGRSGNFWHLGGDQLCSQRGHSLWAPVQRSLGDKLLTWPYPQGGWSQTEEEGVCLNVEREGRGRREGEGGGGREEEG